MKVSIPCLEAMTMIIIESLELFGTNCICLANVHSSNRYEACNRKQLLIYIAKKQGS